MTDAIYMLCALTSLACAALLLRAYLRSRARLLLWSSLCFIGLGINNILLVIDLIVVPETDLALARGLVSLASVAVLSFGLIWDAK
jgi:hypothetical protein